MPKKNENNGIRMKHLQLMKYRDRYQKELLKLQDETNDDPKVKKLVDCKIAGIFHEESE